MVRFVLAELTHLDSKFRLCMDARIFSISGLSGAILYSGIMCSSTTKCLRRIGHAHKVNGVHACVHVLKEVQGGIPSLERAVSRCNCAERFFLPSLHFP